MNIKITGADFSSFGLGYSNPAIQYAAQVGALGSPTAKNAIVALFDGAQAAGIWSKLFAVLPFYGSSNATQKFVFKEGAPVLSFVGSGNVSGGFQNGVGQYASLDISTIVPAKTLTNFAMGAYAMGEALNALPLTLMSFNNATDGTLKTMIQKNYPLGAPPYTSVGQINKGIAGTSGWVFPGSNDPTQAGFMSVVKEGGTLFLLEDSAQLATAATAETVTSNSFDSSRTWLIGGYQADDRAVGTVFSDSTALIKFAWMGELNKAETITWEGLISTFLTTIGRI